MLQTEQLPADLREKILRRAERAWALHDAGSGEHVTRVSDVTETTLRYRLSHTLVGTGGPYSGPKIEVRRERIIRRWWNPMTWFKPKQRIIF